MLEYSYLSEYAQKINSGEIVAPKKVITIYNRLIDELNDDSSSWIFSEERALRAIQFIEAFCKHSSGEWAGKPVILELFQKAFICTLFGIVNKETGLRRFKQAFFMVGRKNGKSTMLAGIALYMLIADGEKGSQVYTIATKLDQAKIIYNTVINMMKQSPALKKNLKKRVAQLDFEYTMSFLKPLATDSKTLDGLNSHCVIIDELHAIKNRDIYEVMLQSMSSRREPLLIMITTAGTVRENIFDDIYSYACNVLNQTYIDETFLPIMYELDEKEEWQDPDMWIKANPNLGVSKKFSYMENEVKKAQNDSKALAGLLTKDFNIRENSYNTWIDYEAIDSEETFNIDDFNGSYFIGGVDLASVNDLTCATALLLEKDTDRKCVEQMYWIPEETLEAHLETDKVPYDKWIEQGYLRVCKGGIVDYSEVTAWYEDLVMNKGISPFNIYYDRWNASYWIDEMEKKRFPLTKCAQGAKTFSTPMKHLEADLKAHRVAYNSNPILMWCLSNTGFKIDENENIRPVKAGSRFLRIDGMISLLNAYVGLIEHYQEFKDLISYE